jgi:hypothetical protein
MTTTTKDLEAKLASLREEFARLDQLMRRYPLPEEDYMAEERRDLLDKNDACIRAIPDMHDEPAGEARALVSIALDNERNWVKTFIERRVVEEMRLAGAPVTALRKRWRKIAGLAADAAKSQAAYEASRARFHANWGIGQWIH